MRDILQKLCSLPGVSGRERPVREYIQSQISDFCECTVDRLGNLTAYKKGKKVPKNRLLVDAHMDEVGLIVTAIEDDGLIRFRTVGKIDPAVLPAKRVRLEKTAGVIGAVPVHLTGENKNCRVDISDMYIDIGAVSKKEAERAAAPGDVAWFDTEPYWNGSRITARAIDDRAGCAQLIELLREESAYDFHALFSVQEEVGSRGAKVGAYAIDPDYAFVLEATAAADIPGATGEKSVCKLGEGAAISFMDDSTLYDSRLYGDAIALARRNGIKVQPETGTNGGSDSGAIHLSRDGVKALTLSTPCRYPHTPCCVADINDIEASKQLVKVLISNYADA